MLHIKSLLLGLLVWLACISSACSTKESTSAKFLGEWKSVEFTEPLFIKRSEKNYILTQKGQPDLVATYDDNANRLMIDAGVAQIPVVYLADTDEILLSSSEKSTKFARVKGK